MSSPPKKNAPQRPVAIRVILRPLAEEDVAAIASHIAADSPLNAERFVLKMLKAISRLATLPEIHPLAPESEMHSRPIRELIVKPYRVLFLVEDQTVRVLRVRHGSRDVLMPEEDSLAS